MAMPALIPAPASDVPGELQVNRDPSVRKRRKGRTGKVLNQGNESM